jgi:hypothetical protein
MWRVGHAFGGSSPRPYSVAVLGALALWLGFGCFDAVQAREQKAPTSHTAPSEKWTPTERWAWSQIEMGGEADFNERCRAALDSKDEKDARWRDDCRTVRGKFVRDLLTRAPWREATPFEGVGLIGAVSPATSSSQMRRSFERSQF